MLLVKENLLLSFSPSWFSYSSCFFFSSVDLASSSAAVWTNLIFSSKDRLNLICAVTNRNCSSISSLAACVLALVYFFNSLSLSCCNMFILTSASSWSLVAFDKTSLPIPYLIFKALAAST